MQKFVFILTVILLVVFLSAQELQYNVTAINVEVPCTRLQRESIH
jgi:hypothetical protein